MSLQRPAELIADELVHRGMEQEHALEAAAAIIGRLGLEPRFTARLTSGGGQTFATFEEAQAQHEENLKRLGPPGAPVSLDEALVRGEAYDPDDDIPPPARAEGVYMHLRTKEVRDGSEQ